MVFQRRRRREKKEQKYTINYVVDAYTKVYCYKYMHGFEFDIAKQEQRG